MRIRIEKLSNYEKREIAMKLRRAEADYANDKEYACYRKGAKSALQIFIKDIRTVEDIMDEFDKHYNKYQKRYD